MLYLLTERLRVEAEKSVCYRIKNAIFFTLSYTQYYPNNYSDIFITIHIVSIVPQRNTVKNT